MTDQSNAEVGVQGETNCKKGRNPGLIGVERVPNYQIVVSSIMSDTSKMNGPLHMQQRRAGFFDEDPACVGELHTDNPPIVASEQLKSMLFFDLCDLSAERRLGDVQSVGGPSKVQLLGQNNDCVKVTHFNVGEHCSIPLSPNAETGNCPTSSEGTGRGEKVSKRLFYFWAALARPGGPQFRRRDSMGSGRGERCTRP